MQKGLINMKSSFIQQTYGTTTLLGKPLAFGEGLAILSISLAHWDYKHCADLCMSQRS